MCLQVTWIASAHLDNPEMEGNYLDLNTQICLKRQGDLRLLATSYSPPAKCNSKWNINV